MGGGGTDRYEYYSYEYPPIVGNDRHISQLEALNLEGLIGENEDEMIAHLIKICDSIEITLYKNEVEAIVRYRRRDVA